MSPIFVAGRTRREDERGAIGVIVALLAPVVFGSAAFAIDLGNAWQSQRQLRTATDSAALAAAQDYASGGEGCVSTAGEYLASNDDRASLTGCIDVRATDPTTGYVTVKATAHVEYTFAPVIGIDGQDVHSSTTAGFGVPGGASGLRPIAICVSFPALSAWLNAPGGPVSASGPITVPYTNADQGCASAPGNWDLLDYDDGGGGADEVSDLLINGYPIAVTIPSLIAPKTGHVSSISSALAGLVDTGAVFPIPLFDQVEGTGKNARYHAVAVARVRLLEFDINGSPSNQYLTVEFVPGLVTGSCCGTGIDTGARAVTICAVNTDPIAGQCNS
jgi:Flp pilus assembly protein TadG